MSVGEKPVAEVSRDTDWLNSARDTETQDAREAALAEHDTTFWQALKENQKAVFWSAIISLTIVMEGYDVGKDP